MTDVNGNPVIRDVSSHKIPGLLGAPENAYIGGPGIRAIRVTARRFPDLDPAYVKERDHLELLRKRAAVARAARKGSA